MPETQTKTVDQRIGDAVRDTLGSQLGEIIQLRAQLAVLAERAAGLEAENAALKAAVAPLAEGVT